MYRSLEYVYLFFIHSSAWGQGEGEGTYLTEHETLTQVCEAQRSILASVV